MTRASVGMPEPRLMALEQASGEMPDLRRGAAITLLLRLAGGAFEFLLNLCIARMFGAEGAGLFYVAFTVTTAGAMLARLGLDNSLLRLGAAHAAAGEWSQVESLARRGLLAALLVSVCMSFALYLGAAALAALRPDLGDAAELIQLAAIAVAPLALACLYGELLKSVGRILASQLVLAVAIPALALGVVFVAGQRFGIGITVIGYDFAALAAAALGWVAWRGAIPRAAPGPGVAWREIFHGTWSLLWVKAARMGTAWLATAVLLAWSSQSDVGIYNVALRVSLALGLLLMSVNSVAAPRFAAQFRSGNLVQLRHTAHRATALVLTVAGPVLAVLLLAPGWVMGWFGAEFGSRGAPVLFVLALGQCLNLLTGPVNYLLMMSGNEDSLGHTMTASVIAGALATVLLVPSLGALGAAIGTSIAMGLQSLAAAWLVWSKLGILALPLPLPARSGGGA